MTLAAEELHITHGAISRQIRTLESHLGSPLFQRLTRKIVLTETGAEYHAAISRLLGELTNETERLRGPSGVARLWISTSVSFASKWLAPRLHRFKDRHKELDVYLDVTDVNVDLGDGQVDAAIRYGSGRYPHVLSERILDETVTPVCNPSYLEAVGGLSLPGELMRCMLLHEDRMLANWEQWFALAGLDGVRIHRGAAYSHGSLAIDAAIRGEGIALGRSALVTDDIVGGRLVAPFPQIQLKAERGYDLVYRQGNQNHPKIRILRDWLADEVRQFIKDADAALSGANA
jgi:LysR family glycine cleavage system transcriptional activator